MHGGVSEHSEGGGIMGLFCKYVLYIEFSRNVEYLYLVELNEFRDVFFTETGMLHPLYCEIFWCGFHYIVWLEEIFKY